MLRVPEVRMIAGRMFVYGEESFRRFVWYLAEDIRRVEPSYNGPQGVGTWVSTSGGNFRYSAPVHEVMAILSGGAGDADGRRAEEVQRFVPGISAEVDTRAGSMAIYPAGVTPAERDKIGDVMVYLHCEGSGSAPESTAD